MEQVKYEQTLYEQTKSVDMHVPGVRWLCQHRDCL